MPPLPVVYGVLGLPSGVKALMAEKAGASSQSVHTGDTIGEFKIASLDAQNVTFLWEQKEVHRKIEDLIDRSGPPENNGAAAAVPAAGGAAPAAPPRPAPSTVTGPAALGAEIGAQGHSERACRPGDNSPADTVIDGYKKTVVMLPFGAICRWVPVQ